MKIGKRIIMVFLLMPILFLIGFGLFVWIKARPKEQKFEDGTKWIFAGLGPVAVQNSDNPQRLNQGQAMGQILSGDYVIYYGEDIYTDAVPILDYITFENGIVTQHHHQGVGEPTSKSTYYRCYNTYEEEEIVLGTYEGKEISFKNSSYYKDAYAMDDILYITVGINEFDITFKFNLQSDATDNT